MKKSNLSLIAIVCAVIGFLCTPQVMAEMGMALPIIENGQGVLDGGKNKKDAALVLTSAGTMGEMGASLPMFKQGEGIMDAEKTAAKAPRIITSAGSIGEMGTRLPVMWKAGDEILRAESGAGSNPATPEKKKSFPHIAKKQSGSTSQK